MIALKEWACVVLALERGIQTLLLRKGGILDPAGEFRLDHDEFLLYPTYEHQREEMLKPEHRYLFQESVDLQRGKLIRIGSKARVVEAKLLASPAECEQVFYRHIYTEEYVGLRRAYKPDRPLWAVQVETIPIAIPLEFTETAEQSGCKSWVEVG